MDQLQDPSVIQIATEEAQLQAQDFINRAMEEEMKGRQQQDNAITKFLREAESKREKEESQKDKGSESTSTAQGKKKETLIDLSVREFDIEDWDFEYFNEELRRIQPSELLAVRRA